MSELSHVSDIIPNVTPVRIVIPGRPAAYQRKTGVWHSRDGRSGVNAYASKSYSDWKSYARGRAAEICPKIAFPNPQQSLIATVFMYFPIPASKPLKFRRAAIEHLIRPSCKPDVDNTWKAIADSCLTGIVFHDDRQVDEVHIYRWFDESPRVEIEVWPWIPRQEEGLFTSTQVKSCPTRTI